MRTFVRIKRTVYGLHVLPFLFAHTRDVLCAYTAFSVNEARFLPFFFKFIHIYVTITIVVDVINYAKCYLDLINLRKFESQRIYSEKGAQNNIQEANIERIALRVTNLLAQQSLKRLKCDAASNIYLTISRYPRCSCSQMQLFQKTAARIYELHK